MGHMGNGAIVYRGYGVQGYRPHGQWGTWDNSIQGGKGYRGIGHMGNGGHGHWGHRG